MASLLSQSTVFSLTVFVVLLSLSQAQRGRKVGGRTPVRDVESNEEVQQLGRFAVDEFNRTGSQRRESEKLEFDRVVEAQRQVVSGVKYFLKVVVSGGMRYDAVVVFKPWADYRELVSFSPASADDDGTARSRVVV